MEMILRHIIWNCRPPMEKGLIVSFSQAYAQDSEMYTKPVLLTFEKNLDLMERCEQADIDGEYS